MEKVNKSNDSLSSNIPAFYVFLFFTLGIFTYSSTSFFSNISPFIIGIACLCLTICAISKQWIQNNSIRFLILLLVFFIIGILRTQTLEQKPLYANSYTFTIPYNKKVPYNRLVEVQITSQQWLFKNNYACVLKIPDNIDSLYSNQQYIAQIQTQYPLDKKKHIYFINKNQLYYYQAIHIKKELPSTITSVIKKHQQVLIQKVNEVFKDKTIAALVLGLLIGTKTDLPNEVINDFKTVGAMHLLAVSGMHTALLFQCISWLLIPIGNYTINRLIRNLLIATVLIYFCLLSNNSASIVRATIMCIVLCIGLINRSPNNSINTLGISGLLIVYVQPFQLWDIGFQLSFTAVMGILYANYFLKNFTFPKFVNGIVQTLTFTFFAQLFTLPILLYHFHSFSTYFLISNLVLIPLSTLCIFIALFLLILSTLFAIPTLVLHILKLPYQAFLEISNIIAQWEHAYMEGIQMHPFILALHLLLIVVLLTHRSFSLQLKLIIVFICCHIGFGMFYHYSRDTITHHELGYKKHLLVYRGTGWLIGTQQPSTKYIHYLKSKYALYDIKIKNIQNTKNYLIKISEKTIPIKATKYRKKKYIG